MARTSGTRRPGIGSLRREQVGQDGARDQEPEAQAQEPAGHAARGGRPSGGRWPDGGRRARRRTAHAGLAPVPDHAGRGAGDDRIAGNVLRHDRVRPHDGARPDGDAVEHDRARPEPATRAHGDPPGGSRLLHDGHVGPVEVVPAAHHVAVGGQQGLRPDPDRRCGEHRAVVGDVDAILEHDVALLAREEGVPAEKHPGADLDAAVCRSLGVQHASVVDGDVIADPDLPGVPQHDTRPEADVPAAGAEQPRIEPAA